MQWQIKCIFFRTESLYPVKTKYIVADFSHGKEIYEEIEKQLSGIPVGILGKLNYVDITSCHQFECIVEFIIHELNICSNGIETKRCYFYHHTL